MSTSIDDLPGIQNEEPKHSQVRFQELQEDDESEYENEDFTQFKSDEFSISSQINKHNILILVLLVLATLPEFKNKLINILSSLGVLDLLPKSNYTIPVITALILLIAYILIKQWGYVN